MSLTSCRSLTLSLSLSLSLFPFAIWASQPLVLLLLRPSRVLAGGRGWPCGAFPGPSELPVPGPSNLQTHTLFRARSSGRGQARCGQTPGHHCPTPSPGSGMKIEQPRRQCGPHLRSKSVTPSTCRLFDLSTLASRLGSTWGGAKSGISWK